VGDVLRVEAEQNIDGIRVTSVLPPKAKSREPERLELIAKAEGPLVSSSVTGRDERRGKPEGRRPARGERPPRRERAPRPAGRDSGTARRTASRAAPAGEDRPSRPRPKRLHAGRAHRDALLATLPPEQVPAA